MTIVSDDKYVYRIIRPGPKPKEGRTTGVVGVRLPKDELAALRKYAAKHKMTVQDLMLKLTRNHVKRYG